MKDKIVEILKDLVVNLRTSTHYSQDAKALDQAATKIAQLYSAGEEVYVEVKCNNELPRIPENTKPYTGLSQDHFVFLNGFRKKASFCFDTKKWNTFSEEANDNIEIFPESWLKKLTRPTVSEGELENLIGELYDLLDDALLPVKFRPVGFNEEYNEIIKKVKAKGLHLLPEDRVKADQLYSAGEDEPEYNQVTDILHGLCEVVAKLPETTPENYDDVTKQYQTLLHNAVMKLIEITPKMVDSAGEEVSCENCKYNLGESYHDRMWCRDCRQKDRFDKKPTRQPVSEEEIGNLAEIEYPSKGSSITKFQRLAFRRGFKAAIKELNR